MSFSKKVRYQIEFLALKWLAFSIPLLPRKVAQGIGTGLGNLAFTFDKRGRTTALENLNFIFDDCKAEDECLEIAKESYRSFGRVVMDQFWTPRLKKSNFLDICTMEFEDPEAMEKAKETGAIWVTPHYSNFEWVAFIMGFHDYNFTVVAQDFKNPKLTSIFRKNRELSGHEVIPPLRAVIRLLKNLKRGGHPAFLSDLAIIPSKAATVIECFGHKACVTATHAELMMRTGLPMFAGLCQPQPDGSYVFKWSKAITCGPDDTAQTICQACWDLFEPYIRENPAPWLWMYKHFRYKSADDPENCTSYAGSSENFDELEERIAARKLEKN